jgi:hypothetical protein
LAPDLDQARAFLKALDPGAARFTFQTFDDNAERKDMPVFTDLAELNQWLEDRCIALWAEAV